VTDEIASHADVQLRSGDQGGQVSAGSARRVGDDYVLPTGQEDESRLDLIHAVYGPISLQGLDAARIGEATRVADIGCGTGTIARWMAQRITPGGSVDAIDIADEQVEVARSSPAPPGAAPIQYHVGSAYEAGLPARTYDVVFCRLVLCHLQEPARAVAAMANLLVEGGRLVLVDMDMRDTFTMPPCPFYESILAEVVFPYGAHIGVDYAVGVRLPELMSGAGLATESVVADQPIFRDGPEKHLWERTWAAAFPRVVAARLLTADRSDELISGAERHTANPDVWVAVAKMFAVVGRKLA
jgi:2-polyprenyl-3-methyl-5-hydroxy-6-metoxy-1,4-benzoquinol methylase